MLPWVQVTGRLGRQVPVMTYEEQSGVGMSCMSVSGQYDNGVPLSADESFALFRGVYDAGCRHFDTAEVYKSGPLSSTLEDPATVYHETQLSFKADVFKRLGYELFVDPKEFQAYAPVEADDYG